MGAPAGACQAAPGARTGARTRWACAPRSTPASPAERCATASQAGRRRAHVRVRVRLYARAAAAPASRGSAAVVADPLLEEPLVPAAAEGSCRRLDDSREAGPRQALRAREHRRRGDWSRTSNALIRHGARRTVHAEPIASIIGPLGVHANISSQVHNTV